jgi:hypothetical protein
MRRIGVAEVAGELLSSEARGGFLRLFPWLFPCGFLRLFLAEGGRNGAIGTTMRDRALSVLPRSPRLIEVWS